MLCRHLGSTT
ncbi:hypothetical protein D039_0924A, partial [Vibrio parahaemolyticus EKP-028]